MNQQSTKEAIEVAKEIYKAVNPILIDAFQELGKYLSDVGNVFYKILMTDEELLRQLKKEKKRKRYYRMMARRGLLKQKKYVPFATHPEYDKITNAEANGEIPRNYYQ